MFLTVWSQLRFEFHIIERQFKSSAFPFAIHSNKCILVVWSFRAEFITFGWRLYSKNWRNCQLTAKWIWDFLDSFRWSSLPEGRLGHTSPTTSSFKPWHCVIHPPATWLATDITTHDPLLLLEGKCQGPYPRCHTVHSSRSRCPAPSTVWHGRAACRFYLSGLIATGRSCWVIGLHGGW